MSEVQSNGFPAIGQAAEATAEGTNPETGVQTIESLCMQCHENGVTRMLLASIPFFKEVVVVSFFCPHCGFRNNSIQPAGEIQRLGSIYTVKCTTWEDLDRQLVRGDGCTISIPEYALQLPPSKGQLTTIEGIISDTIRDLSIEQPLRRVQIPDAYEKIEALLDKLRLIVPDNTKKSEGEDVVMQESASRPEMPAFTIKLDDPSGNSFIEAVGGLNDPKWTKNEYERDRAQNEALGLAHEEQEKENEGSILPDEVHSFPSACGLCGAAQETLMKTVNIPHFKDIVLMSTNCHACGYRDTEVKSGGAISPQGRKITLKVEDSDDLSRDLLKSDTAGMSIPEIGLELNSGTLGGRFTTLEGILNQVYEELDQKVFAHGDSASGADNKKMEEFLQKLKLVREVSMPYTVIIDDPVANSYIQNLYAPDEDPNMTTELYDRTFEQNEELGLNDMKTEDY